MPESEASRSSGAKACFAHSVPGLTVQHWEPLEQHLREVAELAAAFAAPFAGHEWARLIGLWHDLGKYRRAFQRYLRAAAAGSEDDGSEECSPGRVDHSTVGAIHATRVLGSGPPGRLAAYLIAGHHAGLPDFVGDGRSLRERLAGVDVLGDWDTASIPPSILRLAAPRGGPPSRDAKEAHLWLRMLFSCLTDADFLATEAVMAPEQAAARPSQQPAVQELADRLRRYLAEAFPVAEGEVARARDEVLRACWARAGKPPGVFTLTVPTGGGKTLSSMAFALEHARRHGKRRVIYAIPYTSIIEQTADVFRQVFGDSVLEHHSNLDPDDPARDTLQRRLASENWHAPIVVTTNVQLFESLFAARSSRCRKLHNIVNSVVVLDEAQLLPPEFLDPIRQCIRALQRDYGVTFVISTATQPCLGFENACELAPDPAALDARLRRVRYEWPASPEGTTWPALGAELASHPQVLCVVNRRDDARELFEMIRGEEGAMHLSALMCGAHRSQVLASVRAQLRDGRPVRLVTTQLVEAGVDLDFPVVYRAFAGLDSIAQAAGRCNREGRLPRPGRVVVFNPPTPPPPGLLRKAASKAREVLDGRQEDHIPPGLFTRYFQLLYEQGVNSLDAHDILGLLGRDAAQMEIQFRTAADRFRLVDESGYLPVVVDWGPGRDVLGLLRSRGRLSMRRVQRYVVNIPRWQLGRLLSDGQVDEVLPGLFGAKAGAYDDVLGLRTREREYEPGELIC